MSWIEKYRKWKQRDFLSWRNELSDYEKNFLLPLVKGHCEVLLKYCKEVDVYCSARMEERNLGIALRALMLPEDIERFVPVQNRPPTPEILARNYFSAIQKSNKETFIDPLEREIPKINSNLSLAEFSLVINRINGICATTFQNKETLFLYNLSSLPFVRNANTNEIVMAAPKELNLLLFQFQNVIENMVYVAKACSENLLQWHKEVLEQKTEFLKLQTERIAQRNNLLAIVVAVAVSWAFLTATQPLEGYQLGRENEILKSQAVEALDQKFSLEEQNKNLNLKIEELKSSLAQAKAVSAGAAK